jgi:hypothetical protein
VKLKLCCRNSNNSCISIIMKLKNSPLLATRSNQANLFFHSSQGFSSEVEPPITSYRENSGRDQLLCEKDNKSKFFYIEIDEVLGKCEKCVKTLKAVIGPFRFVHKHSHLFPTLFACLEHSD